MPAGCEGGPWPLYGGGSAGHGCAVIGCEDEEGSGGGSELYQPPWRTWPRTNNREHGRNERAGGRREGAQVTKTSERGAVASMRASARPHGVESLCASDMPAASADYEIPPEKYD